MANNTLIAVSEATARRVRAFAERLEENDIGVYDRIIGWGLDELETAWAKGIDDKYRNVVADAEDGELNNPVTEPVEEAKPNVR